ncbi:MAG TPA: hypothetical protein VF314_14670 [Actinomycetes bacterium]
MQRHELDLVSLVAGLLFVVAGAAFLVGEATDLRVDPAWVLPVVLVGLGVTGLVGASTGRSRQGRGGDTGGDTDGDMDGDTDGDTAKSAD